MKNIMKAIHFALVLSCLAFTLAAETSATQTRVDLGAVISKDFVSAPTVDQAASTVGSGTPFGGFGWEVIMGRIGLGGSYAVAFSQNSQSGWWLDWNAPAIYTSFHVLGPRSFIDPFVNVGIGCAGRIYLGPMASFDGRPGEGLALTIFPFVSAGAALVFDGFHIGAKLGYTLGQGAVPVTVIPAYPLGRFQATAFAGFSIGGP